MRLRLVVPLDVDEPTGGNVYDLSLAAALRRAGDDITVLRMSPSSLPAALTEPPDVPVLVDGLLACTQSPVASVGRLGVLVHMPLALQTGLSGEAAAELDRHEGEVLRAASFVVATSRWSARYLQRRHGLGSVWVAQPGADRAAVSCGSRPPLLAHVAALLPHKDQIAVVTALGRLTHLPWQLRLAGSVGRDPAYAARVRRSVDAAGIRTRVEITGALGRDDAWAAVDLALLPSRVESYGLVVTEALARGIPAVVSAGGPQEALGRASDGGQPGLVVAPGDVDGLTAALHGWLTDPALRERLRSRALSRRDTLEGWDVTASRVRAAVLEL